MKHKISFSLSNDFSELNTLQHRLKQFGEALNVTSKNIFELNLALDEVFTNIVSCGYRDHARHWIDISICLEGHMLTISIEDDGVSFNPVPVSAPDLKCPIEERRIGGLGIHIVKQMTDEIAYFRSGGKNILVLKKNISDRSDTSAG